MQFCHQRTTFLTLNIQFAYCLWSKMSVKGIIMFLGMNNTRLERKILIILDFENGVLPTYLPMWSTSLPLFHSCFIMKMHTKALDCDILLSNCQELYSIPAKLFVKIWPMHTRKFSISLFENISAHYGLFSFPEQNSRHALTYE